ncbi:MAG: thymidine phosphorylase family protein [Thiohalophilus sp.]|uniref:thymidine phosphorylase family protein n=1 Tax=Thiohalophilus sp. TaxID=3028392 RepID=UPI002870A01B|nr:thymidine phosphorylase family protein [Thiohalophilus sp.]MDR9437287.1 thymidine phosphorylase family protein [Thiohalophilus sp.]
MTQSPAPEDNGDKARLKLRRVAIDTYHENVAYLHRNCELYRAEGFQALSKIVIMANGRRIHAVLNVVDDEAIVGTEELGLAEQAFAQLDMQPGEPAWVVHAEPVESMDAVRRKIRGERLLAEDYQEIASDIAASRYSKMEMAAFLVACTQSGLDREETLYLTRAMADTGEHMHWDAPLITDKHCIGGLPGNRTTMLIVPIVAAHGLLMPKTSSRAITSPAGTADTMSVLARVDLSPRNMHQVVNKTRACLAWGGRAHLAPADDILISVERPLGIDSESQMVASILSKKLAAGATHLLIDIPVGPTAKVRHMSQALRLRKLFEYIGDRIGIHLEVVISDGSQPIGRGIGPMLEARDVMQVLEGDPDAPSDLRQKALRLAGRILEFDPDVRGGQGYGIARDILEDGRALRKMQEIIAAQGKIDYAFIAGPLNIEIKAEKDGVVTIIDNFRLAKIASLAGAPMERAAGVDLLKKLGDPVTRDEPLYRIHAAFSADFNFARHLAEQDSGYRIGHPDEISHTYMEI